MKSTFITLLHRIKGTVGKNHEELFSLNKLLRPRQVSIIMYFSTKHLIFVHYCTILFRYIRQKVFFRWHIKTKKIFYIFQAVWWHHNWSLRGNNIRSLYRLWWSCFGCQSNRSPNRWEVLTQDSFLFFSMKIKKSINPGWEKNAILARILQYFFKVLQGNVFFLKSLKDILQDAC